MKREYKYQTNCELGMDRQADYETLRELQSIFSPIEWTDEAMNNCNGNLAAHYTWSVKTKKAKLNKEWKCSDETQIASYEIMPSALVLYRLCSFGEVQVRAYGQEGYKCVWTTCLMHTPSGRAVFFGEHKGSFSFWTKRPDEEIKDKEFIKDLTSFLTYLASDKFAHPYDGLIAGSVA